MEPRIRFLDQLNYARAHGIGIDIEGVSYSERRPQDVIRIMQSGSYMVDYESDLQGHITAIHINNVNRVV